MELSPNQLSHIMKRFPQFELSYETNLTNQKNNSDYTLAVAVPSGKKVFAWFTFHEDKDVCYLLDLNKDKKIIKASMISNNTNSTLSLGTIVYGTIISEEQTNANALSWFVVEDIYYYKGVSMKKCNTANKLDAVEDFMYTMRNFTQNVDTGHFVLFHFVLPVMWCTSPTDVLSTNLPADIAYTPHHIQYRAMNTICPYINVFLTRKMNTIGESKKSYLPSTNIIKYKMDFAKPQYRYATIFQVTADIQFDIYNLFAFGKNKVPVFYNIAYVPNYKSSVFLNGLFRNIRENKNLDYIEESDDDDDFQNLAEDKYVDLSKTLLMECVFHTKFKRWIPIKVVDNRSKVVHIGQLVRDYF
jgi:hypothetical protein